MGSTISGIKRKRDYRFKKQLYFDVLLAVKQEFENMYVGTTLELDQNDVPIGINPNSTLANPREYEVNENTVRNPFGIRLGYKATSYRIMGTGFGAEIGFRPGPGSLVKNVYLNLGFNINIFAI